MRSNCCLNDGGQLAVATFVIALESCRQLDFCLFYFIMKQNTVDTNCFDVFDVNLFSILHYRFVEPIPLSGVANSQSFWSRERLGVRSRRISDDVDSLLFSICLDRLLRCDAKNGSELSSLDVSSLSLLVVLLFDSRELEWLEQLVK